MAALIREGESSGSALLALLPSRCVVCASPLRTLASRECALGPECATLLEEADVAPNWRAAKALLNGVISFRPLRDHWGVSARRVVARLVVLVATVPRNATRIVPAIDALGFVTLAQAIGSRRVQPPTRRAAALQCLGVDRSATAAEIRAAFRRKLIEERLHPDLGGDVASLQRAIEARRAAEKRAY